MKTRGIKSRTELFLPFAELAEVDDDLLGNVGRDVDLSPQASHAHVRRVRRDGHPALATQSETFQFRLEIN